MELFSFKLLQSIGQSAIFAIVIAGYLYVLYIVYKLPCDYNPNKGKKNVNK